MPPSSSGWPPVPYTVHLQNEVTGEGIGLIEIYDKP